jgi:hypothetical protein
MPARLPVQEEHPNPTITHLTHLQRSHTEPDTNLLIFCLWPIPNAPSHITTILGKEDDNFYIVLSVACRARLGTIPPPEYDMTCYGGSIIHEMELCFEINP